MDIVADGLESVNSVQPETSVVIGSQYTTDYDAENPPTLSPAEVVEQIRRNFPAELVEHPQPRWVCWKYDLKRKGKPAKRPINPNTGASASVDDPATWGTFEQAAKRYQSGGYDGIGYVFVQEDGLAGIDLDDAIVKDRVQDRAYDILQQFPGTYAESSVSETGIHILARNTAGVVGKRRNNVEVYSGSRFFVVTGDRLGLRPSTITAHPDALARLLESLADDDPPPVEAQPQSASTGGGVTPAPLPDDDAELWESMFRATNGAAIQRLYNGDTSAHGNDHSAADQALCNQLAFWARKDAARMDRMFRQSGLYREEKWDKRHHSDGRTYGQGTIDKAIADTHTVHSGTKASTPQAYTNGSAPAAASAPAQPAQAPALNPDLANVSRFCTDYGNARRFVEQHATDLRYVPGWGWLVWDGQRWKRDADGETTRRAKQTVLTIFDESKAAHRLAEKAVEALQAAVASGTATDADKERLTKERDARLALAKTLTDWAMKSQGEARIKAMISLAESELEVIANVASFDADLFLLNVENGTLDLRTGQLRPHSRDDLLTKMAPVNFDPNAAAPLWDKFIKRIFQNDADLIGFVQRMLGYTLTGATTEQCFMFAHGNGANGKSTLFEVIQYLLGPDYARTLSSDALMARNTSGGIPNDLAALQGARLVVASEIEEGARWAESKLKDWTGGDILTARFLHKEFFDFKPQFKLCIFGNHKPVVRGLDEGIWRRVRLVPFEVTIPANERDRALVGKLREELPGILAWMVRGCIDWRRDGLGSAEKVALATDEYREENDIVGRFITECCIVKPGTSAPIDALYSSYVRWCGREGINARSKISLGKALSERAERDGLQKKPSNGVNWWIGIGLLEKEKDEGK